MPRYSKEEIREWVTSPKLWPNAESHDLDTLEPCGVLANREAALKEFVPPWFWTGEPNSAILSLGTGKGYFERKYWRNFARIYSIDPSIKTQLNLEYFPIPNFQYLSDSLFHVAPDMSVGVKYGWLGASIHYLFGEFHGWEFMHKLAMIVRDTLVVDAGVFDSDTPQGKVLAENWKVVPGEGVYQKYRQSQFSYGCFRECIKGLWTIVQECPTPWIDDGRRTMILKRILPPVTQKSELGALEPIHVGEHWGVYKTDAGYYKESPGRLRPLLICDTVSKVMGWDDMVQLRVYDGDRYTGFVTRDYGDQEPANAAVSERMHLSLLSWLLPLGLIPADLAKQNIRICNGDAIWIDVELFGLSELNAQRALWTTTNIYKEYHAIPSDAKGINRVSGSAPNRRIGFREGSPRPSPVPVQEELYVVLRDQQDWRELMEHHPEIRKPSTISSIVESVRHRGLYDDWTNEVVPASEIIIRGDRYRETLLARGLICRTRAVVYELLRHINGKHDDDVRIFCPEALSHFARLLRARYLRCVCSEFTMDKKRREQLFPLLCEDLERLSFPDGGFDVVVVNEIFEHVPDLPATLAEIARVLRPGGVLISTFPFAMGSYETLVKARLGPSGPEFLIDPEYHGDPMNPQGALVFQIPGWDIIDTARRLDFADAQFVFHSSSGRGITSSDLSGILSFVAQR